MAIINMAGETYGRWTSISYVGKNYWMCVCRCGVKRKVRGRELRSGHSKSCGCLCRDLFLENRIQINMPIHGMNGTPTHRTWTSMKSRCSNPKDSSYGRYGGRGISVCSRWSDSFVYFVADMGPRPEDSSIDRINNEGDYCPDNCKWSTSTEQARNRRNTRYLELEVDCSFGKAGTRKSLMDWADISGIYHRTLRGRANNGWTTLRALTEPIRK